MFNLAAHCTAWRQAGTLSSCCLAQRSRSFFLTLSILPDTEQVLMPSMVLISCAVPLAIWLRRDAFLRHREPVLAFKHLAEAVVIAHVMPRKVALSPPDYTSFLIQWCAHAVI